MFLVLKFNLLFVKRVSHDNNSILNFDASFMHIKDRTMGTTLLEGTSDIASILFMHLPFMLLWFPFKHLAIPSMLEKIIFWTIEVMVYNFSDSHFLINI